MRLIDADELRSELIKGHDLVGAKYVDLAPTIEPCEDAISIEVAIQTTWMILNGMGYPKDQNEELDQTIKAVFDTAPRVLPNHSGEVAEMVEDAISREYLRTFFADDKGKGRHTPIDSLLALIDDAPSVAPSIDKEYLVNLILESVYDGEACGRLLDMVDRPKGEWIENGKCYDVDGTHYYTCSVCEVDIPTDDLYDFCPNCGAEML